MLHQALLRQAFRTGRFVIIGLTTDKYLLMSKNRDIDLIKKYGMRKSSLSAWLNLKGYSGRYKITPLHDEFRRELLEDMHLDYAEAIVVSTETEDTAKKLNRLREEKEYDLLDIITIPLVLAQDGGKISSERIRHGEIDSEGKLV